MNSNYHHENASRIIAFENEVSKISSQVTSNNESLKQVLEGQNFMAQLLMRCLNSDSVLALPLEVPPSLQSILHADHPVIRASPPRVVEGVLGPVVEHTTAPEALNDRVTTTIEVPSRHNEGHIVVTGETRKSMAMRNSVAIDHAMTVSPSDRNTQAERVRLGQADSPSPVESPPS